LSAAATISLGLAAAPPCTIAVWPSRESDRPGVGGTTARTAGLDGVDLVGAEDIADPGAVGIGSADAQLAVLAVRLEMAAVYLRLIRG